MQQQERLHEADVIKICGYICSFLQIDTLSTVRLNYATLENISTVMFG